MFSGERGLVDEYLEGGIKQTLAVLNKHGDDDYYAFEITKFEEGSRAELHRLIASAQNWHLFCEISEKHFYKLMDFKLSG